MRNFRKYTTWELRHKLTLIVYDLSKFFAKSENFGLTPQIQRAPTSILTNIIESSEGDNNAEFNKFLMIAVASASKNKIFTSSFERFKSYKPYNF